MNALAIVAPTDAQLGYIASLCIEQGLPLPVVYSKQEASERCTADEAKYTGEDPRTDEEQERAAFAEGRSAYDPDNDRG